MYFDMVGFLAEAADTSRERNRIPPKSRIVVFCRLNNILVNPKTYVIKFYHHKKVSNINKNFLGENVDLFKVNFSRNPGRRKTSVMLSFGAIKSRLVASLGKKYTLKWKRAVGIFHVLNYTKLVWLCLLV